MTAVIAAGAVVLAAVVVGWPLGRHRARRRRVLAAGSPPVGRRPLLVGWSRLVRAPGRAAWLLVAAGVVLAVVLGGPVAGLLAGGYGSLAARIAIRRGAERAHAARRRELLDLLGSAAADLRAGLPAGTAFPGDDLVAGSPDPLLARVRAAARLAEQTGAPLADVIERIEADARSTDRAQAASAAQVAGSRATAWLLAALPAGGIALGYAIGTDPLAVLLHTPIGAACAAGALTLQLAGLAWAGRLTRPAPVGGS